MQYEEPNKCFICHGEGNLISANICCGISHYHSRCFNTYCTEHGRKCRICHKNIDNQLQIIYQKVINWDYCCNTFLKIFAVTVYVTIITMGYFMFSLVCKEFNKPYPIDIVCITLFSPICSMLLCGFFGKNGTKEGCLHWIISEQEFVIKVTNYATNISCICIPSSPIILLIMSSISFYYPSQLSYQDVYFTYCFVIWGGNILFASIIILHIIFSIVCIIASEFYNCIAVCIESCYKSCCKNCFTTVPVYKAQSGTIVTNSVAQTEV